MVKGIMGIGSILKKENEKVSIITPFFYGERFLLSLLDNIEKCAKYAEERVEIEWIISNDNPHSKIDKSLKSNYLSIVVLDSEENRGIQGARVTGLNAATGDYILFLDQDDEIAPNWILSQINSIGDADGVVCDCQFDGFPFYNGWDRPPLEECIKKEYNINKKNGFVPGQVLLRKSSIPDIWKEHWLEWNCCDDQLLWLSMFGQGAVFVANKETCYYHRKSGNNQSKNLPERYMSNREMIDVLSEEGVLKKEELNALSKSRDEETILYLRQNVAQKKKIDVYKKILACYEKEQNIIWPVDVDKHDLGIYGVDLGKHLIKLLNDEGVRVECFLDRNTDRKDLCVPIFKKETMPKSVRTIINTVIMDQSIIEHDLKKMYPNVRVISIFELFGE